MRNFALLILLIVALGIDAVAINPPGTKKVKIDNTTIYVDQEEINVADWLEYIRYLEHQYGKGSDELNAAFPDGITSKEMMVKMKLTNPITGITLEQALKYCQWRTDVVNSVNEETGLGNVKYTLPTEAQYAQVIKLFGAYEILSARNKTERIIGLQSNVFEMTAEGSVLKNNGAFSRDEKIPSENVGFRCIATVEKQRR
ncbi:MAG: hypothetical protein J5709_03990 [Bacteroidales bacterium]|nr:hypothetical protein [Bacteroidales bacterium]